MKLSKKHLFERPVKIYLCRDGTISYRSMDQKKLIGAALMAFSVDTHVEARDLQVRFGRVQYHEHPDMPGATWYKLSRLPDGSDPIFRPDRCLRVSDLEGIGDMFEEWYQWYRAGGKLPPAWASKGGPPEIEPGPPVEMVVITD